MENNPYLFSNNLHAISFIREVMLPRLESTMTGNSSERERHFANTKESRPANASASIFIITISVNIDLYERLAQHARTSGVNQNQIIIEMLDNNLPQP